MAIRSVTRRCSRLAISSTSSSARKFLQTEPRKQFHSAPLPLFDFLIPSIPNTFIHHLWVRKQASSSFTILERRTFTTSPVRQQTTAVVNPKRDDDGNDMNVEITPRASNVRLPFCVLFIKLICIQRLKEIMSKDANPNLALRIQVESGGCHGFQYLMSLTTLPPLDPTATSVEAGDAPALQASSGNLEDVHSKIPASQAPLGKESKTGQLDEDDTVFAADDGSGAKVVMDGPSLELLKGSKIDYTMELIGSQFKIVDNPLATSSCGCGTSFDIKA